MELSDSDFEDEVRRIARLLWPAAEYDGAKKEGGRERDGVFETDELICLIECTTSKKKEKAEYDAKKLAKLKSDLEKKVKGKAVKAFFITQEEPTADQRKVVQDQRAGIFALSYDQFRAQLIDAKSYLQARRNWRFGSVRDPESGKDVAQLDYVPLDFISSDGTLRSFDSILKDLPNKKRFVLLGDYGAGKSSTMREIFIRLATLYEETETLVFPVLLNLGEHFGQLDPVEALERHARKIGFSHPSHLVRAWRAGYVTLLLDGFDELATYGWAGRTKSLSDLRYKSMELVRRLVRDTPQGSAVVLSGRTHFFNNDHELRNALGLDGAFVRLSLSEFSEEQVSAYLKKKGWNQALPDWLPTRPLLLGYLASRNLLQQTLEVSAGSSPAVGWNQLFDRICSREAEIEVGIDAGTVRRLIERIATLARNSSDGLGPVTPAQVARSFEDICGYAPDDKGWVLLQRLPGLGVYSSGDDSRSFIDQDYCEVARAGDVYSFIDNPYGDVVDATHWQTALAPLGCEVLALRCHEAQFTESKLSVAAEKAISTHSYDTLGVDVILGIQQLRFSYSGKPLFIKDALIPELDIFSDSGDLSTILFQGILVGRLDMDASVQAQRMPRFSKCWFSFVDGRSGPQDLPAEVFDEGCIFDEFESGADTTSSILKLGIPLGSRVLLTVLKKLYAQRGVGRRESALFRGLDHHAQRLVPSVLNLLRQRGFATRTRLREEYIWLPSRSSQLVKRAKRILASPNSSDDSLLLEASGLDA